MANFPRTIIPTQVTGLFSPGALKDLSHSGVIQIRATKAVGWSWSETFPPLNVRDVDHMEVYAFIQKMWNRGEIHDFTHPLTPGSGISPNGLGTAGILVKGAGQSGTSIITDQWPINTPNCVRAGDVIKIAGDNAVYMVSASAGSDGLGDVTIPLHTALRVSPADNAAVTTTGVLFRGTLLARSKFEPTQSPIYYADMRITITEVLI